MRRLLTEAGDFARTLVVTLLATFVLLTAIEVIWPGSVTPYISFRYLLLALILVGVLALWAYKDRIQLDADTSDDDVREADREKQFKERFPRAGRIPIAGWFAKRAYGLGWDYCLSLLLTLGACYVVRYWYASVAGVNLDEGNGLYDANLILNGATPFKDYVTREPGYLYTLALFIKLFGYNIMTGRLMAVIAATVTCFFIFKIGKALFGKKVGLLAALIFALSPHLVYLDVIGYLGAASFVWVPIFVYLLILAVKSNKLPYYLLSGLFVGVAMLFYRGYVVYVLLCPAVLLYSRQVQLGNLLRRTGVFLLGFLIPVIPTLAYFVAQTDIRWIGLQLAPPGFISLGGATGVMGEDIVSYLVAKERVLYCLFRGALYLFIPALFYLSLLLRRFIASRTLYVLVTASAWALIVLAAIKGRFVPLVSWGLPEMPASLVPIFFSLLIAMAVVSLVLLSSDSFRLRSRFISANMFLVLWFCCASVFFVVSAAGSDIGDAPAVVMAAVAVAVLLQPRRLLPTRSLSIILLLLLIGSAVFGAFVFATTVNPDRGIPLAVTREIGQYVKERTAPGDEILTGTPAFAVEADRRIIFDISHPLAYVPRVDDPAEDEDPYNLTPSIPELINYLKEHDVKYIVADERTHLLFISDRHLALRLYILDNYHLEKLEGDIAVYARNGS